MTQKQPYIKRHFIGEDGETYVALVDPITGEIVQTKRLQTMEVGEDETAFVSKMRYGKRSNNEDTDTDDFDGKQPYFVKLFLTNYRYIVRNVKLSHGAWALLAKILPFISYESNYLVHPDVKVDGEYAKPMSCRELAKVIAESPSFVSRGMGELKNAGIIRIIEGKRGDSAFYILNPHVLFRGGDKKRGYRIKEIEQVLIFDDEGDEDALKLPIKVRYKQKEMPHEDDMIA